MFLYPHKPHIENKPINLSFSLSRFPISRPIDSRSGQHTIPITHQITPLAQWLSHHQHKTTNHSRAQSSHPHSNIHTPTQNSQHSGSLSLMQTARASRYFVSNTTNPIALGYTFVERNAMHPYKAQLIRWYYIDWQNNLYIYRTSTQYATHMPRWRFDVNTGIRRAQQRFSGTSWVHKSHLHSINIFCQRSAAAQLLLASTDKDITHKIPSRNVLFGYMGVRIQIEHIRASLTHCQMDMMCIYG